MKLGPLLLTAFALFLCRPVRAEGPPQRATFALIVGANRSVDADLPPLKYADDDGARYFDLFRLLGARTTLLARLDDNTRRLHPQAAAEAGEPTRGPFDRALAELATDVKRAAERGVETVVYFVYAGHGNVAGDQGYITLEDARITGAELAQVMKRIPAARIHVVVDACASYFLAYSRGPGGQRRALEGFRATALADDARIGVLLSTSSARESHEWDAFQSGVFSHEVRSGLYGAADADGDGVVTYREIAAFVARANAAVPNERYRPDVYARAPDGNDTFLVLRPAQPRRILFDGKHAGHYFLEDAGGVRIADAHNAPGQTLSLVLPRSAARLWIRTADGEHEYAIDPADGAVALADLAENEPRTRARGAAHESFRLVFALPFDRSVVDSYPEPTSSHDAVRVVTAAPPAAPLRHTLGYAAVAAGGLALAAGTYLAVTANRVADETTPRESQADTTARNDRVRTLNLGAAVGLAAGGAVATTGLVLLLWPSAPRHTKVSVAPGSLGASFEHAF